MLLSDLIAIGLWDESLKALAALLESLELILEYGAKGKASYDGSRETQDAIMYRFICAGEAAKRLSDAYEGSRKGAVGSGRAQRNADMSRVAIDEARWKDLMGIRDILSHKIDEQDLAIVWYKTVIEVPLMVQPVWEALSWASVEWFATDYSPGRVHAKKKANSEMLKMLDKISSDLANPYYREASISLKAVSDPLQGLISAATSRLRDCQLPHDFSPAELALQGIVEEVKYQTDRTIIAERVVEAAEDNGLENEALGYGSRPQFNEILVENVKIGHDDGAWSANIIASVSYADDEDDETRSVPINGKATGTIKDGSIEVDAWE